MVFFAAANAAKGAIALGVLALGLGASAMVPGRCAAFEAPDSGLTSPMVDASLFRDGEVRRLSGAFGGWRVVCDEIPKLKQRYCSLKTAIVAEGTRIVGVIDVSTGDNGQPAALVRLPLGLLVQPGLDIRFAASDAAQKPGGRPQAPLVRHLSILTCDRQACFALWTLTAAEIAGLRQEKPIAVRFQMATMAAGALPSLDRLNPPTSVEASVLPAGFASAIKASLQ